MLHSLHGSEDLRRATLLDPAAFQSLLSDFQFDRLFNEYGWDRASSRPHHVKIDNQRFTLTPIAQKRGVMIYQSSPDANGHIPPRATLIKIEREAAKLAHEHLLIFIDKAQSMQTWLWVAREPGAPNVTRVQTWRQGSSGEALRQKLSHLAWSLEEEEGVTLSGVVTGLKRAFDRDRVTRAFYTSFEAEHKAFAEFVTGFTDAALRQWYASLMLNRLMFVYFIQYKGFLDNNTDYLNDRMRRVCEQKGDDQFYSFYRRFLRRLFHEGLGKPKPKDGRGKELDDLLGDVPYLNGGLFEEHQIEESHKDIDIPDDAFRKVFAFFDRWNWHLDDRPLTSGNEINPEVLGYIFEKYVNKKQMGAYYTKEDITGYIAKNTVIPFLLARASERCKVAFDGDTSIWSLLRNDPDRYLYPAMKRGVVDGVGNIVPETCLPDFVQKGIKDAKARMFERRYNLGGAVLTTATGECGTLPTETWREYVERRTRCLDVRERMRKGAVREIDDLITLNLDIRQFMQDVIEVYAGPELLRAVWQAIVGRVPERSHEKFRHGISILDPTCGSGAFLFAALNVLKPLYEACLERMEGFLEEEQKAADPETDGPKLAKRKTLMHFGDFRKVLEEVARHPSREFFIYKSIVVHNLFGVDIMPEAVEICKLRLFLKLVSQVASDTQLEPLPDIDFNIRTGNTLVGYTTLKHLKDNQNLASERHRLKEIIASAADLSEACDRFREQQIIHGGRVTPANKRALRQRLNALSDELDRYLAREYGVHPEKKEEFSAWCLSHQPFHWFAQFHGVMADGGFDVVIGNPPYIEYSKIRKHYRILEYATESCGNLYAPCIERSFRLQHNNAFFGFIVQQPITSTIRMAPCRDIIQKNSCHVWSSTYDDRPSKLFDGMHHARLSIILSKRRAANAPAFLLSVTRYNKWFKEEREGFFQRLKFVTVADDLLGSGFPKISTAIEIGIINKLARHTGRLEAWLSRTATPHKLFYKITGVGNWFTITLRAPRFFRAGNQSSSTRENVITFRSEAVRNRAFCILNSTLFYWLYQVRTNCRDFNPSDYRKFPLPDLFTEDMGKTANELKRQLDRSVQMVAASHKITGAIEYEQFRPRMAKPIVDQIDGTLASHYKFTENELDFIINYDIKYRMSCAIKEE